MYYMGRIAQTILNSKRQGFSLFKCSLSQCRTSMQWQLGSSYISNSLYKHCHLNNSEKTLVCHLHFLQVHFLAIDLPEIPSLSEFSTQDWPCTTSLSKRSGGPVFQGTSLLSESNHPPDSHQQSSVLHKSDFPRLFLLVKVLPSNNVEQKWRFLGCWMQTRQHSRLTDVFALSENDLSFHPLNFSC